MGLVPEEVYNEQARTNTASGIPFIEVVKAHDIPLAVVGGGPSVGKHLDELREWPGHIWAINQGASWFSHFMPEKLVWMFTVDPDHELAKPQWTAGVERAILGITVSPKLVEALKGKDVKFFNPHEAPENEFHLAGGPSSVCRTFIPAICLGYKNVTYFGCEGSINVRRIGNSNQYSVEATHSYRKESRPRQMIVKCGDEEFVSTPDLYLTTRTLAKIIQEYPLALSEKSGGLLRGMLEHPDTWEVVAYSEALAQCIAPSVISPENRYERKAA